MTNRDGFTFRVGDRVEKSDFDAVNSIPAYRDLIGTVQLVSTHPTNNDDVRVWVLWDVDGSYQSPPYQSTELSPQLWAPTCITRCGLRGLMRAAQGREMFHTKEEAQAWLDAVIANTNEDKLRSIFGEQALGTFRVDVFACWHHGDPRGVWVDE